MADEFETHRPRLLALAYRLLGSWVEAQDVVQETHIRWSEIDAATIDAPSAWLNRVVTNACLDVLKSARVQRETYVGPWLPEPVATDARMLAGEPVDPESISLAFLTLLERLSPLERAVYVLAEAFDYTHDEIAAVLGRDASAVRQLLHRAREHVRNGRPRFAPDSDTHARLLGAFASACAQGDVHAVETLLATDVVARSDGGGRVRAALRPVHGANNVARLVVGLVRKGGHSMRAEIREVNGWPALIMFDGEQTIGVTEIETDGTHIFGLSVVTNPEKLGAIAPR